MMLLRSLLYVPGHNTALIEKAAHSIADAVVFDLEDAVPLGFKQSAREQLSASADLVHGCNKQFAVRVNSDESMLMDDLSVINDSNVDIVVLPKIESADEVIHLSNNLSDSIKIIGLIESPKGLINAVSIATSSDRLLGLSIGTEDFSLEMGMSPTWDSLIVPSMQLNLACKFAGISIFGYVGSISEFRNINAFHETLNRSKALGFEGGFAIHPNQLSPLNTVFSPSPEEVEFSKKVVNAFTESSDTKGAVAVDGKMIDLPVAKRCERILFRNSQIEKIDN